MLKNKKMRPLVIYDYVLGSIKTSEILLLKFPHKREK